MPHRHHPLHLRLLARRSRLRKWLRPLPRKANVARYPVIKWFAEAARSRPWLWSFRRREVLVSLYSGAVLALLPVYGLQLLIGFALAVWLRGNLTVMAALQMVTNPLTLVPIYAATLALGHWLIGATGYGQGASAAGTHFNALVIGGVVAGLGFAVALDATWRLVAWEARRFRGQWRAMHAAMHRVRPGDDDGPPAPR
jgi:uncharacterized protein (DUF2062 family)